MTPEGGETVEPRLVSIYDEFSRSKARGTAVDRGSFDPMDSPLHGRAVFLVGAPRSGTTWLQQLLALHPSVATAGEMHIFCEGVSALFANHAGTDEYSGLSGWVTRAELTTLVRRLVDGIMLRLRDTAYPQATHVLDKTPNHVPYAALLGEVYPDAAFVHIIRDGRDSSASARALTTAGLWNRAGGYGAYGVNAARWRDAVLDCRHHLAQRRYVEVRYEDLLADAPRELARIYETIELPYDASFLSRSVEFAAVPINVRPSDTGLRARKYDLSPDAQREVFTAAGELLVELGYADSNEMHAVLSRRTVRSSVAVLEATGRRAVARGRRETRRWSRQERLVRDRNRLRTTARRLVDSLVAGQPAQVIGLLADDVTMTDAGTTTSGQDAVARHLVSAMAGMHESALDVDSQAAVVRWAAADGAVQIHRLEVDRGGRIRRVVIEGLRSPSA